jgi:uncharacterized protein (TIGR02996 family)
MSDDDSFLLAILAAPHDQASRLVYADWLEERGDPRGEYLRLHCQLIRSWSYANQQADLLARAYELRSQIDPGWLDAVRCCTTPPPPVDVEQAIPALRGRGKTTVRLHPRRGIGPIDASKIGGVFLWPSELADAWPTCDEHRCPLTPAIQLRKEDVPEIGFPADADLFQVLWCPYYVHERGRTGKRPRRPQPEYGPAPQIFWWKRSDIRNPIESLPPSHDDPLLAAERVDDAIISTKPCVVFPERVIEYPDICELVDDDDGMREVFQESDELYRGLEIIGLQVTRRNRQVTPRTHDEIWRYPVTTGHFYQTWLSTADGTKVGGYPDWMHYATYPRCSCGSQMELLVNFASGEFDALTWGRWLPIEERELLGRPNNVHGVIGDAAGWCFGDMGTVYLFVCRNCKGMPTDYALQTC